MNFNIKPDIKQKITKMFEYIKEHQNIVISGHIHPDGDSLGSAWALKRSLELKFPEKNIYLPFAKQSGFEYLIPSDWKEVMINDLKVLEDPLIILVDVATWERVPFNLDLNLPILRIDHHLIVDQFETLGWIDDNQPSTCEMIYHFLSINKLAINREIAQALFTGMITDTGNFTFPKTTAISFLIAAKLMEYQPNLAMIHNHLNTKKTLDMKLLNFLTKNYVVMDKFVYLWMTPKDCRIFFDLKTTQEVKRYVNLFKNLLDYRIWAIFIQMKNNDAIEGSLRSFDIDLSKTAKEFNGGGHAQACGVKLTSENDVKILIKKLAKLSYESY